MPVAFEVISDNEVIPGHYVEAAARQAEGSLATQPMNILAIGYRGSGGSIAANVIKQVLSDEDADLFWEQGSMLAEKCRAIRAVTKSVPLFGIAVDPTGAAATASTSRSTTRARASPRSTWSRSSIPSSPRRGRPTAPASA